VALCELTHPGVFWEVQLDASDFCWVRSRIPEINPNGSLGRQEE